MTAAEFTRARSVEAKQARETAILDAATSLATDRGVRAVTLTDIAAAVDLHKSTMLRYFETREEIFLRLSAAGWVDWSQAAVQRLGAIERRGGSDVPIADVAAILADTLTDRALFCDLLAHTPLNLERGVSFEAVRVFKTSTVAAARSVADAIRDVVPVSQPASQDTVATATALAGALWQMAAPGTELRRFYEMTPDLAHTVVDVGPRLTTVLTALLLGYTQQMTDGDS